MHLTSLDVNGFKSFALPTHLTFTKGMTAIVGPNGSGKSNVADAVRWVLGEMSLKTLRGKKSEDVIFAGSHSRARHSMAEVSLTFDNSDDSMPVDAAEVVISRRLYRNGDSEYEINGTIVRLMDVQSVLVASGLANRGYAVVGQGQVDAILRASPLERKDFFEEAAGVKQFQSKKDQALRKLETTRRNLIRVDDLLKEIKPRLASLKRQADRAALRDELQRDYHKKTSLWFSAELASLDQAAKKDVQELERLEKSRETLDRQVSALEQEHSGEEERKIEEERDLVSERLEKARGSLSELIADRNEKKQKRAALESGVLPEDVSDLPTQLASHESALDRLTRRAKSLVPQIESIRSQVTDAEKEQDKTSKQIAEIRKLMGIGTPKTSLDPKEINDLVHDLRASLTDLMQAVQAATAPEHLKKVQLAAMRSRDQLDVLASKVKRAQPIDASELGTRLDSVLEARDIALATLATQRAQLATRETEHGFLTKQIGDLEQKIASYQKQIAGAQKGGSAGAAKAALAALTQELKETEQQIAIGEEQVQSLQQEIVTIDERVKTMRDTGRASEETLKKVRGQLAEIVDKHAGLQVTKGQYEVRRSDLIAEVEHMIGQAQTKALARGGADAYTSERRAELKLEVEKLRTKFDQAGAVDDEVLKEYEEIKKRNDFLSAQTSDLQQASNKLRDVIGQLDTKIQQLFTKQLSLINLEFDKAFKVLFDGGSAKLLIVRPKIVIGKTISADNTPEEDVQENPEDEVTREIERLKHSDKIAGVDIKATPPGKKLQGIGMLSGGEKALTSIALLSAILATKPSPFVILDEVDAALDEANSRRFGKIIKSLSTKSQFITITHNRETMRHASILYGVTMQKDGVSKVLSVKLDNVSVAT